MNQYDDPISDFYEDEYEEEKERMREELKQANISGKYCLYGDENKLDSMSYKELQQVYMNMRNHISDSATHTDY